MSAIVLVDYPLALHFLHEAVGRFSKREAHGCLTLLKRIKECQCLTSLVPTRKKDLVSQVEFLGLAHALATV